jgi:hypothetical protein
LPRALLEEACQLRRELARASMLNPGRRISAGERAIREHLHQHGLDGPA